MKAIVYHRYGSPDVVECAEIEKPSPGDDQVLIRVRAAAVNPLDWHLMRGDPFLVHLMAGLRKPKVPGLGVDMAGVVEAVGKNVTQFKPGDEVFGSCRGAFAEYACASPSALAIKPAGVTFEQAAALPVAACTALQTLRNKGRLRAGQKVLINGAGGGVGTYAVQIAKLLGAEVTGVCSTPNVEMVRSIGADQVIDYTRDNFTQHAQRYDLIVDCAGNHSLSALRRVLSPNGMYVMVGGSTRGWLRRLIAGLVRSLFSSRKLTMVMAKRNKDDLAFLVELLTSGKLESVIGRRYPLTEAAEAIRYLEQGHARGKVIIEV
jgi:NADPH:quinone reductase-like Zn-dependent oxidoreductase